jgi:uncharacterized protein (DUF488 family)
MINIFTIGYSTYSLEQFISTLKKHSITAIVDVRSSPYSKFKPEFNRNTLQSALNEHEIEYVFLGEFCGARIDDPSCYQDGKVDFNIVAKSDKFKIGINRILSGVNKYTVALMCAEKDPVTCHRFVLICKNLKDDNINLFHILENSKIEKHSESEFRLLKLHKLDQPELFRTHEQRLHDAYNRQGSKIAYKKIEEDNDN